MKMHHIGGDLKVSPNLQARVEAASNGLTDPRDALATGIRQVLDEIPDFEAAMVELREHKVDHVFRLEVTFMPRGWKQQQQPGDVPPVARPEPPKA